MGSSIRNGQRRGLAIVATGVLGVAAGFAIGLPIGRSNAPLPDVCTEAMSAADTVASAVEAQWETASAAVDAVQTALSDSELQDLAAECEG